MRLSDHLKQSLPGPRFGATFDAIMRLDGVVHRRHKNRRTIETPINGRTYFIKTHGPAGWGEILKNALRFRWPVLTAEPEWNAIHRLRELGVRTVHAAGFGVRGRWPHRLESFIITDALQGMIPLNELVPHLNALSRQRRAQLTRTLLQSIAQIARSLHLNGLNHRDFYLIHFLIRDQTWPAWTKDDPVELHLIDLHRVQVRSRTRRSAIVRDISGLVFSALDCGLTMRDWIRFLAVYFDEPRRTAAAKHSGFTRAVVRRARRIYQSEHGKSPRLPAYRPSFA